jgi:ABC-type phosphate transport system permease subunit
MTLSRLIRFTAMLLISALLTNSFAFAAKKPADPAAMRAKVLARGVGQGVRVTIADNTEVNGLIVSIGEQSFTVKPRHANQPQEIQYAQVTGVHNNKMGTGTKIIIVAAIAGATIGIIAAIWAHRFDEGFKNIPTGPISALDLRKSPLAFGSSYLTSVEL